MTHRILQLFPELTNVNGDAENARVLARRLEWAGADAEVVPLTAGEPAPSFRPDAVVLGSGVDSVLARTREALEPLAAALGDWVSQGVPVLAVGTGMELLGHEIPLDGGTLQGLGILPGMATALPARVAGEIAVRSDWGVLVGYENHARGYRTYAARPMGQVLHGTGNGDGAEGIRYGSVFGTHLHGPVLARNPSLAMAFVAATVGDTIDAYAPGRADGIAEAINAAALRRLGVG
ncbi:type 1 glutamine amidotransferase [Naasia sp. SYSU D00948]|uniref:type 1 glutamine amidotransferase n=1 Tax=Naasia sp. SYSU D00948 TaxID=2817379 RepID=UPI001B317F14|nr:glutamine amidotransferase [Naasia sp. SYSU D00948]